MVEPQEGPLASQGGAGRWVTTARQLSERLVAALPPRQRVIETLAAMATVGFARAVTGVRPNWLGCEPEPRLRVYYANHSSHGDFVLIWACCRDAARARRGPSRAPTTGTRAAAPLRRRTRVPRRADRPRSERAANRSCHADGEALGRGVSLIVFPEGTRNTTEETLLPFKSGLYHLAKARPGCRARAGVDREPRTA